MHLCSGNMNTLESADSCNIYNSVMGICLENVNRTVKLDRRKISSQYYFLDLRMRSNMDGDYGIRELD